MKALAVIMCLISLLSGVVVLNTAPQAAAPAQSVDLQIQNGQISLLFRDGQPYTALNSSDPITVRNDVEIRIVSHDFVYLVEGITDDRSALVLPGIPAEARAALTPGDNALTVSQGCGDLFDDHIRGLVLHVEH